MTVHLLTASTLLQKRCGLLSESTGLAAPERSSILRIVGLSLDEAVAALAPDQREARRDEIVRAFRERSTALRLTAAMREPMFPGAASLLRSLAEREDVILGLATGKSRRGVARIIEQHGLDGIFATVQTADDAPSKPHPAMLLQAMDETETSPARAVMIGDTSYDMLMAASANVASIGVTWGYHTKAELRQAGAKTIVHSFAELAARSMPVLFSRRATRLSPDLHLLGRLPVT